MSYKVLAYDDSQVNELSRFLVDNVSDITNLPINSKPGSRVTVANTGAEYMLNNQNEWKLQTAGSGSGGGGTWSGATWGDIAGSIEDQIDLQSALDKKQNTLVSGTNIKTINGNSLIGSGDITIIGEDPEARANIKVIANVTRTTSSDLSVDSLSCDKTYEELAAMINNAGINIPVIKYVHQFIPSSGERDEKYLYLREINNEVPIKIENPDGPSVMSWGHELVFYELGPAGEYFSMLSNNKYSIKNFEPSDHITKGIITYNSETEKYSCSETFYWLGQMVRQNNYTTFITYENKIYSLLKASTSNDSITSLLFGYLNTTTNKIELFTITDSAITYDEVALGSGAETITYREMTSTDTNVTLANNTFYSFPEMKTLTVTAPDTGMTSFRFYSGKVATTLTVNNANMPDFFSVEAYRIYEINIYERFGVATSWNYTPAQ